MGGVALFAPSSGAATLACPNFNDVDAGTPPAGQTGYLFIGTSVSTDTSSITVTYSVNGGADQMTTIVGTQQGNGAFHYVVDLPQGAVVSNATVTGATGNTVVTVSGCINGPALPTTTTLAPTTTTMAPTTTTGAPTVSPGTVANGPVVSPATAARPSASATAPSAVSGVVPRTTG
jgi:hypothetical protein